MIEQLAVPTMLGLEDVARSRQRSPDDRPDGSVMRSNRPAATDPFGAVGYRRGRQK
jgi:hypothetical protein